MTQIRKQKSDKGWRQRPIGQKPETAETKKVNHLIPFFLHYVDLRPGKGPNCTGLKCMRHKLMLLMFFLFSNVYMTCFEALKCPW